MAKSKSNKRGIVLAVAIMAVIMAGVIALLVCTDCLSNWNKYCQRGHDYGVDGVCKRNPKHVKPIDAEDAEYFQIESEASDKDNYIELAQIKKSAYSAMGIASNVESAYTLTATIAPAESDNQRVLWKVEFENPNSAWAKGKNPETYVKAQPTVDGSKVATVTCLKAFSEPINVIATSEDNEVASASCLCDYVKRVTGMNLNISSTTVMFSSLYTVDATPQYSEGTIDGDYAISGYKINLVSEIATALNGLSTVSHGSIDSMGNYTHYTAEYHCSTSTDAKLTVNVQEKTFSFNGTDAFDTFGTYHTGSYKDTNPGTGLLSVGSNDIVPLVSKEGSTEKAISALRSSVNNTFKQKVTAIAGAHMVFTFDFTYTYQGKSYVETTATANLKFDAETLAIHVVSLTLNNDHIVF